MSNFYPWITFEAVKFLRKRMRFSMSVFEYGCGSSTIFYAEHCASVESVEHEQDWATKVAKTLEMRRLKNWKIHHVAAEKKGSSKDFLDPDSYYSKAQKVWFRIYSQAIILTRETFDLISVDGRSRAACMKHSIQFVKPGGFLVLDNSERPRYGRGADLVPQDWKRWDFTGPGSSNAWKAATEGFLRSKEWQTTIWQRPAA